MTDAQRLAALRDTAVKMFAESFDRRDESEWVLDFLEESLLRFHEQGVDRILLNGCRTAYFDGVHLFLTGQNLVNNSLLPTLGPVFPERGGFVYALQDAQGLVKIGRTVDPMRRLQCIRTQSGKPFVRVYVSPQTVCFAEMERHLHKKFAKHRGIGEWFGAGMDNIVCEAEQFLAGRDAAADVLQGHLPTG